MDKYTKEKQKQAQEIADRIISRLAVGDTIHNYALTTRNFL
jgi:hypothetical protein